MNWLNDRGSDHEENVYKKYSSTCDPGLSPLPAGVLRIHHAHGRAGLVGLLPGGLSHGQCQLEEQLSLGRFHTWLATLSGQNSRLVRWVVSCSQPSPITAELGWQEEQDKSQVDPTNCDNIWQWSHTLLNISHQYKGSLIIFNCTFRGTHTEIVLQYTDITIYWYYNVLILQCSNTTKLTVF